MQLLHDINRVNTASLENQLTEIRDYARLLKTGMVSLNRIKIYLCGQPEAGKITFARALIRSIDSTPADLNPLLARTRGINITTAVLANGVSYSVWDFAGQSDYHVHHDIFMFPEAALFIIIIDVRNSLNERHKHALYWLQYIVTQCPPGSKPSVLLLASHVDEIAATSSADPRTLALDLAVLYHSLGQTFADAVELAAPEIIQINCKDQSSPALQQIEGLLETTRMRFLSDNPTPTPLICKQMIDITQGLCGKGVHYMSWTSYCDAMRDITDDIGLLTIATRHMHRIGDLYYNESARFKGLVIIDLGWLCHDVLGWVFCPPNMLKVHEQVAMMRFRQLAECGAVKKQDIPITHKFADVDVETLDVLEAFELCYGFVQEDVQFYVFPSLLRASKLKVAWDQNDMFDMHVGLKLACTSSTTMIPPGFFQRVQVRVRLDIGPMFPTSSKTTDNFIWANGTLCQLDDAVAKIDLLGDMRTLTVHVRGMTEHSKHGRALIQRILQVMQAVCEHSPGLRLSVEHMSYADLAANHSSPRTYPQQEILEARRAGLKQVVSLAGVADSLARLLTFSDGTAISYNCIYN